MDTQLSTISQFSFILDGADPAERRVSSIVIVILDVAGVLVHCIGPPTFGAKLLNAID